MVKSIIARLAITLAAVIMLAGIGRADMLWDQPAGVPHTIGNLVMGLNAVGNSGTAKTVDFCQGNIVTMTLTGNVTLTFSNIAQCLKQGGGSTQVGGSKVVFIFTQDGTGGRTVTWPSTAKFPTGTAPIINNAASAVDTLSFTSDGTNLYLDGPANPNLSNAAIVNTCTWSVTLSSGVATTTVPCLAAYSHVGYQSNGAQPTGTGAPTPTAVPGNIRCAQAAANSTTIKCVSSSSSDARVVDGFGY